MDESQIDDQREAMHGKRDASSGGARMVLDPRVTRVRDWAYGAIGVGIITASGIAANNLYQLNLTVARGVANDALAETRFQDHEARIRQVERDVSAIEGKVFRSGFDPLKEPVR